MTVREQNRAPKGGQDGRRSQSQATRRTPPEISRTVRLTIRGMPKRKITISFRSRGHQAETLFGPEVSRPSRVTPYKVVAAQMVLSLGATLLWWLFYKSAA